MRTTLVLDDEVVKEAKKRAAELGATLGELTNRALRDLLVHSRHEPGRPPFFMPVFGNPDHPATRSPEELAQLRDEGR